MSGAIPKEIQQNIQEAKRSTGTVQFGTLEAPSPQKPAAELSLPKTGAAVPLPAFRHPQAISQFQEIQRTRSAPPQLIEQEKAAKAASPLQNPLQNQAQDGSIRGSSAAGNKMALPRNAEFIPQQPSLNPAASSYAPQPAFTGFPPQYGGFAPQYVSVPMPFFLSHILSLCHLVLIPTVIHTECLNSHLDTQRVCLHLEVLSQFVHRRLSLVVLPPLT